MSPRGKTTRSAKPRPSGGRAHSRPAPHAPAVDTARAREFGKRLRAWYRANGRDLPWRRTRDAYHILVSELMLQQTQVSRVVDYYARFLERFPTLGHVARAHPDHVLEAWEGLGYYARARNLHRLAHELTDGGRTHDGALPSEPEALRALPGVGAYTAGAVASFAYERRAALVDTNVARVLQRVFAPRISPRSSRGAKSLWSIAERILPRGGRVVWTHNQALMELGALVCTARVARCDACPVRGVCASAGKLGSAAGQTPRERPPAGRGAPPDSNMPASGLVAITASPRPGAGSRAPEPTPRGPRAPAKRPTRGRDARSL